MVPLHLHVQDALVLLAGEFAQLLLYPPHCLVHGPQLLLYSLRVALAVVVQVVPIVLQRVLNVDEQLEDVVDDGILVLRVVVGLAFVIGDGVFEALLVGPAELLLDHAVVALLKGNGLRFASGQEQRPRQSALGVRH